MAFVSSSFGGLKLEVDMAYENVALCFLSGIGVNLWRGLRSCLSPAKARLLCVGYAVQRKGMFTTGEGLKQ